MGNILRKAVEQRRNTIINILLALNVFKNENELINLSLTELEHELKRLRDDCHPHSEAASIKWKNKKS